ncbi:MULTISPECIES: DUF4255 domain-containing protein [unclassified Crossiella]|uniref:DUF4255 domain-containing protein n=1 Tax=unclassified Crossiella TaxID=2620835 RepID=UPI001FFFCEFD|nr:MULTISPECIES: DUF4255 domain-containing protein [unclassified Crossiella]MCK2242800.1 DUF4255 domain-containing protein [Crossiella sp. S99.2]MCK2256677.1 DUF4255 domain-containing protein [Crossiella sp. S99.1]
MSNARVIEAVTQILKGILQSGVDRVYDGVRATTMPPDKVGDTGHEVQLNLFLYQTTVDSAWRNDPFPANATRRGESGFPPLPLVLHYLVTPVVRDGDEIVAHRVLGGALRALHDHPVLSGAELNSKAPYARVAEEVESVSVTPLPAGTDELTNLWSAFQTPYRMSMAYEARVVLIESERESRAPVPVLRRGEDDRGPIAVPEVGTGFPTLDTVEVEDEHPAALLGEAIVLRGTNLAGADLEVSLSHPLLGAPVKPAITEKSATHLGFRVPADVERTPAGFWTATVSLTSTEGDRLHSNAIPVGIGPRITSRMPMEVHRLRDAEGSVEVNLTLEPEVRPGQRVFLLLGSRAVPPREFREATGSLEFRVPFAEEGSHLTRVRVDGVDTRLVNREPVIPVFDDTQRVTVR